MKKLFMIIITLLIAFGTYAAKMTRNDIYSAIISLNIELMVQVHKHNALSNAINYKQFSCGSKMKRYNFNYTESKKNPEYNAAKLEVSCYEYNNPSNSNILSVFSYNKIVKSLITTGNILSKRLDNNNILDIC